MMDAHPTVDLLGLYIITVIMGYGAMAAFSYAYYVLKTQASIELQDQFQATLNVPSKWLFVGGKVEKKAILQIYLLYRSSYKSLDEFFQKVSLKYIQFQRIGCAVIAVPFAIMPSVGIFNVPANARHLMIPYVLFLALHLYTLYASLRFGHKLVELSQDATKAVSKDSA